MESIGSGAAVLDLLFQIGSYRSILFDFGTDISTWTFEFSLKKNKGDRIKTLSLSLGSGLSFPVYLSDQIQAIFTSANTSIEEGQYYYELRRTDIALPLINGYAYFTYDALQGTTDETTLGLTVSQQSINVTISGVSTSPAETAATIGALINSATAKTTPVDADLVPIADSAAAFILKKVTWANLKATLKTYFDTIYGAAGGVWGGITGTLSNQLDLQAALNAKVPISRTLAGLDLSQDRTAMALRSALAVRELVTLTADVTNNNATPDTLADVTGLQFPAVSGRMYYFKFYIVYSVAATTTGTRWAINGPAFTMLAYDVDWALQNTARSIRASLSAYDGSAVNATTAQLTSNVAYIEGVISPSANGNVIARFSSEIAGSAVTAKADVSFVEYLDITDL